MAKLSFADFSNQPVNENTNTGSNVRFFALKPNEHAIVRILCDTEDDFDIHTVHNVVTPQWQFGKRMNCLRDPHEPMDKCPLCAAGKPLIQRLYVKMIHYVIDPQTNIVTAHPVVWERSVNDKVFGARALMTYIDTFGALSNMVCKITRTGEKLDTVYQLIPNLPENVYPSNIYANPGLAAFDNWSILGSMVLDKTAEEYNVFLATGNFPAANAQATPKVVEPVVNVPPVSSSYTMPPYSGPQQGFSASMNNAPSGIPQATAQPAAPEYAPASRQTLPWEAPTANPGFDRPVRRY